MKKAAVVIGIDNTGDFSALGGAASGAKDFADWATAHGYNVELLSDVGTTEVTLADIEVAIHGYVNSGTYKRLLVYFAGHGILPTAGDEKWLLSKSPSSANEAVDLTASMLRARNSGIEHIVFISDACRSVAPTARVSQVLGGSIFPNRSPTMPRPSVDRFFATLPGDPALEVPESTAVANYKGIFTECLLNGLEGKVVTVIEPMSASPTGYAVPSWKLKPHLEKVVPLAAARIHLSKNQNPEVISESHAPLYLAEAPAPVHPPGPTPPPASPVSVSTAMRDLLDRTFAVDGGAAPLDLDAVIQEQGIDADVHRVLEARGRPSFETGVGFTVVGAQVDGVVVRGADHDVFADPKTPGHTHVRIYGNDETGGSILIRLDDGSGVCLAIVPHFVGSVLVEKGRVVSVSYSPVPASPLFYEWEYRRTEVEKRRAVAAVAARKGTFRVTVDDAETFGDYLRWEKALDPTLGLYAAYAYAAGGFDRQVRSVWAYMAESPAPIPFDVALLAGKLPDDFATNPTTLKARPFCPMLAQGWSYLRAANKLLPDRLAEAQRHQVPSLWTTFTKKGADLIAEMIHESTDTHGPGGGRKMNAGLDDDTSSGGLMGGTM